MQSDFDRTLAVLRHLERTASPEERRTLARDLRIGDAWPPEKRREAEAIMRRLRAGGVAPPTWGHAAGILDRLRR